MKSFNKSQQNLNKNTCLLAYLIVRMNSTHMYYLLLLMGGLLLAVELVEGGRAAVRDHRIRWDLFVLQLLLNAVVLVP